MKALLFITTVQLAIMQFANANDICGKYSSVIYRAQNYIAVDKDGTHLKNLPATAATGTSEPVWHGDHWDSEGTTINVPVTYRDGTYTTQETKIKAKIRWKGLGLCKDTIYDLTFHVNHGTRKDGVDITYFPQNFGLKLSKREEKNVEFPTPQEPHQVVLQKRKIMEGYLRAKLTPSYENHWTDYKFQLMDGTKTLVDIRDTGGMPERDTLSQAYSKNLPVRIYGDMEYYGGDWDVTIVYADFADLM